MAAAAVLLAVPAAGWAAGRQPVGTFSRWGAFSEAAPRHCFALSEPVETVRHPANRAFASVASWPGAGVRGQLYLRLSRAHDPRAAVTLSVGERRFQLTAGPTDAWAPDAATDRAIVAAIRAGRSLSVESLDAARRPFADVYSLAGAPSAIDAATLACARR